MPTIDYALAYDFVDPDQPTNAYRLQFRYPYRPGEDPMGPRSNPVGQLVATVKGRSPHGGTRIPISRSGVHFNAVEAAADREHWPFDPEGNTNLAEIPARIRGAGLA
ncbi:hypothetical protein BN1232_06140 [Mycobacterium lentiflavum]|uniref:Uncharacterized protein n=1 Tax=Mycobacterium lentiflavum TaxID=141349 RepID=A0A0E4CRF5_MYCLN|nr:hypothetical protein [Mycobacterium lentiflavum]CQD24281.1 hypothetical protein BN1232_06140 [Mycobacterium lentiflavum]